MVSVVDTNRERQRESVYVGSGDRIEECDLVEFRLLYEGELLQSSKSDTRAKEKHEIRRSFHPQLRRLWDTNSSLDQLARHQHIGSWLAQHPEVDKESQTNADFRHIRWRVISEQWERAGFNFVPLVTAEHCLRCSLDILLLRPEEDRFIFRQGDIDGQVKTLFDALRIPKNLAEAGGSVPQEDESPFFCLLEDDRLISEVRVITDQLLLLPKEKAVRANDCFVSIHVKLNHKSGRTFDRYFG